MMEIFLLKYVTNNGFFRERTRGTTCRNCLIENVNCRSHAVNECSWFEELRVRTIDKIRKCSNLPCLNLDSTLLRIYFNSFDYDNATRNKLIRIIENFCFELYTKQRPPQ